jgi:ABC-type multidrug transport system ATPase subunit
MPQDISICIDFTIEENLRYFARLYGMPDTNITAGINDMQKLLNLPEKTRFVSKLSEGQKRRVSLSIALMHSPQLIILDEPTVGVDPVLRRVIWDYMEMICRTRAATIIITTHYIEEARSATNVAFMRNGRILEEQNPENLLNKFECNDLESVFLKLCLINDQKNSDGDQYGEKELIEKNKIIDAIEYKSQNKTRNKRW